MDNSKKQLVQAGSSAAKLATVSNGKIDIVTQASSRKTIQSAATTTQLDMTDWSEERMLVEKFVSSPITDNVLLVMVIASCILLIFDTNARAETGPFDSPDNNEPDVAIVILSRLFIVLFVIEMCLKLYAYRRHLFEKVSVADLVLVIADALLAILDVFLGKMPSVSFLRIFRLIRIWRFLRIVKRFPELYYLLHGMQAAFLSIMWGLCLTLMLFLVWSIIAVMTLHPITRQLDEQGAYADCDRCSRAFSSVWQAFLTLTQTLLAGDSWGQTALPIIEEAWWTYFVFMGAWASVVLATMNLVLAAIVDSGAQAREEALEARNYVLRRIEEEERKEFGEKLESLCKRIDADDSGTLSKEELMKGFDKNKEFQGAILGMGYARRDLEVIYNIMDEGDQGAVNYRSLLDFMWKAKGDEKESKHALVSMKLAIDDMWVRVLKKEEIMEHTLREIRLSLRDKELVDNSSTSAMSTDTSAASAQEPRQTKLGAKRPPPFQAKLEAGNTSQLGSIVSKQSDAGSEKGDSVRSSKGRPSSRRTPFEDTQQPHQSEGLAGGRDPNPHGNLHKVPESRVPRPIVGAKDDAAKVSMDGGTAGDLKPLLQDMASILQQTAKRSEELNQSLASMQAALLDHWDTRVEGAAHLGPPHPPPSTRATSRGQSVVSM